MEEDLKVIVCNYSARTTPCSTGAKAYVILPNPGHGHDRMIILARSKGGRWISKWESIRLLENFRVSTIPKEHPRYEDLKHAAGPQYLASIQEAKERNGVADAEALGL